MDQNTNQDESKTPYVPKPGSRDAEYLDKLNPRQSPCEKGDLCVACGEPAAERMRDQPLCSDCSMIYLMAMISVGLEVAMLPPDSPIPDVDVRSVVLAVKKHMK